MSKFLFTSKSVTEKHPGNLCDQISGAVLDTYLTHGPSARVSCETAAASSMLLIMGEATASHEPDILAVARDTLHRIGYGDPRFDFDADYVPILVAKNRQSADIALGVDCSLEATISGNHSL